MECPAKPCPVGRSFHAAVCLGYGGDNPYLLVIGGWSTSGEVLNDAWLLKINSKQWKEVSERPLEILNFSLNCTCILCK